MEHVPNSDNYLSAIHVALEMKYPAKMASLTKAYKALRDSMFVKYRKDSAESGVKFVEGAHIMTSSDLSYICRRCLADKEYELRCFFLVDKFGIGRCTEGHWEIDYRKIIGIYWNFDGQTAAQLFYDRFRGAFGAKCCALSKPIRLNGTCEIFYFTHPPLTYLSL